MENVPVSANTGEEPTKQWSGIYCPPETPATYGLGLCGDGVIRPEQQAALDRDVEEIIANRTRAVAQAKKLALD